MKYLNHVLLLGAVCIFDNLKIVESVKCYYYPHVSKTYRYTTDCYYSCCVEPAKNALDACCDSAGSFAALAMIIAALVFLCCLSCISGILVFVFCFRKKPRAETGAVFNRQMQSVTNPIFTSQNFKLENVNELPKYEDLNHTVVQLELSSSDTTITPENNNITTELAEQHEIDSHDLQMNEIDLRADEMSPVVARADTPQVTSEVIHIVTSQV